MRTLYQITDQSSYDTDTENITYIYIFLNIYYQLLSKSLFKCDFAPVLSIFSSDSLKKTGGLMKLSEFGVIVGKFMWKKQIWMKYFSLELSGRQVEGVN